MKPYLSSDQFKLYDLIWRRMLASQIADARSDATTVDTEAKCQGSDKVYVFRATGSVLKFPGFRILYLEGKDDADDEDGKGPLPELSKGEKLNCMKLDPKQHFTQPPPRFTEASLIKALEENGIGRPSTYAPIISTIEDRHYVRKEQGKLTPTILGRTVSDLLSQFFADIMDTTFTARMESASWTRWPGAKGNGSPCSRTSTAPSRSPLRRLPRICRGSRSKRPPTRCATTVATPWL